MLVIPANAGIQWRCLVLQVTEIQRRAEKRHWIPASAG